MPPAAVPLLRLQLAFRSAGEWAQHLLRGHVDAVLVSVAGDAGHDPAVLRPPLEHRCVETIGLGQRELVLFHHPGPLQRNSPQMGAPPQWGPPRWGQPHGGLPHRGQHQGGGRQGDRQRMGYLLPPPGALPLLHRALEREGRLPLHSCGDLDHRSWLEQLRSELLLLPAHPTVLRLPGWRDAGLVLHRPLQPLIESLWLLLRRGEEKRPELARLLQWWGSSPTRPSLRSPVARPWPAGLLRWPWWRPGHG